MAAYSPFRAHRPRSSGLAAFLLLWTAVCATAAVPGGGNSATAARGVREAGLDPSECWRIRDLHFTTDRVKFFFTDGYLILGRPIAGKRITALFSTDVEGGDAEVLLLPPNRAERQSLAAYAGTPNLDEHFATALMLFSPEILEQFAQQIRENPAARKAPEMGSLLDSKFSPVARNLSSSFDIRLTWGLLDPESNRGFFAAMIHGNKLGNFDVVYDPAASEQITVGALSDRDNGTAFDTWTSFAAKNASPLPTASLSNYRIHANIRPDLSMDAVTRVNVRLSAASGVVPLEISELMEITEVRIDGQPAEILSHADLRSGLIRNGGGQIVLAVASAPLEAGRDHALEIHHHGRVILDAGNQVYYIASRANWYPGWGATYTTYDLTFRFPKNLQIVLPGEPISDKTEGEEREAHHRIATPVRMAGFNLGVYEHTSVARDGFTVDVYANREFEQALRARPEIQTPLPQPPLGRRPRTVTDITGIDATHATAANPASRLQALAASIAGAMEFFTGLFGPPPLRRLEVSPVPGNFGQGFPGLLYLSTMAYMSPLSAPMSDPQKKIFFEELLQPHETAHQWWGNLVYHGSYHDEWIVEGLANYSALLYLEKQQGGRKVSDAVLSEYRDELLKNKIEETGPIVQGRRLDNAQSPDAWRVITYGKGTWIIHMLRARMGDAAFLKMLAALRQDFEQKHISTEQFRVHCSRFLGAADPDKTLEAFFDQWVYGTGIPQLKLTWQAKPGRVTGSIKQSGVRDDFSVTVPIEIRAGARSIRKVIRTDSGETTFSFAVTGVASKVTLDPGNTILRAP
jgi:hypothetical protein